jgi:hypothetical protein
MPVYVIRPVVANNVIHMLVRVSPLKLLQPVYNTNSHWSDGVMKPLLFPKPCPIAGRTMHFSGLAFG